MEIVILVLLGVLVVGAVAAPLVRGARGHHEDAREFAAGPAAPPPAASPSPPSEPPVAPAGKRAPPGDAALESEIARYRVAVQAGTVCRRCGEANPADAKFCRECGKPLPASDAQEFAT